MAEGLAPGLIDRSRYALQARPYVEAFGRDRLAVVRFEDLVAEPKSTVRSLCDFIGIDPEVELPGLGATYNDAASRIATGTAVRTLRRSPFARAVARAVPSSLKPTVIRRTAEDAGAFKLSEAQRAEIGAALADDLRALRDDLGVDLDGWTTPLP